MKNFKFLKDNHLLLGLLLGSMLLLLIFISVATFSGAWPSSDVSAQILSALAGAVVTAIITLFLLLGQSANEEKRDKNIKIYQMKLEVYSKFISEMWNLLNDGKIDKTELLYLRSEVYNKLIFMLQDDEVTKLKNVIKELSKYVNEEDVEDIERDNNNVIAAMGSITRILRNDIVDQMRDEDVVDQKDNPLVNLWNAFSMTSSDEEVSMEDIKVEHTNTIIDNSNRQYWHMNMVDRSIQQTALKDGKYELSLIEYEEEGKRTQLLKQVQKGDLIFLYNKGNMFLGIFEAIGRRIFYYEGETLKEELVEILGGPARIIEDDEIVRGNVEKYDIYKGIDDDAYFCSNLIVKPLACMLMPKDENIAAYRPTICRYWKDYGDSILNKYKEALDSNNPNFGKIDDVEINCDTHTFMSLFK